MLKCKWDLSNKVHNTTNSSVFIYTTCLIFYNQNLSISITLTLTGHSTKLLSGEKKQFESVYIRLRTMHISIG